VTTKHVKIGFGRWHSIEETGKLAIECLLGEIHSEIKRIERVREAVVENCQTRDLLPPKFR
jgi:hypothetical protein